MNWEHIAGPVPLAQLAKDVRSGLISDSSVSLFTKHTKCQAYYSPR